MSTVIDTLVTDRVDGASYGYPDINRVGSAIIYIADRLASSGYPVTISPRTNWVRTEFLSVSAMSELRGYLSTLRAALVVGSTTPEVPTDHPWLTVGEANTIEALLIALDANINNLVAAFMYCGEALCGEV